MKHTFTTILLCLLFSVGMVAQGADPCSALTLNQGTTNPNGMLDDTGTTIGAYDDDPNSTVCSPNPGSNVYVDGNGCVNGWYMLTVSTPGSLELLWESIEGTDRDIGLAIYASSDGTCTGDFTILNCETEGTAQESTIATIEAGTVWIRIWDYNCDADITIDWQDVVFTSDTEFEIEDVDGQNIVLDCSNKNTVLYNLASDDDTGTQPPNGEDYTDTNTTQTVTFTAPAGCQVWIKEITSNHPSFDTQICAATDATMSTSCDDSDINDYLKIYDGGNLVNNVIGISASVARRFGNYKSANGSITLEWITGATGAGDGWEMDVYCIPDPTVNMTVTIPCDGSPTMFTDPGGTTGGYGNNAHEIWTFCPAAGCADVVCIDLGTLDFEEYFDALYVFDGMDTNAPLHSIFQGANNTSTGILRAMPSNASGCLTFMLLSDTGVDGDGWNSSVFTCPPIGPNGGETCATATDISAGGTYHNNTYQATGTPNEGGAGMADPAISSGNPVTDGSCDPTGTGTSDITQLESTVWYTFTTPPELCEMAVPVVLDVDNVSCVVPGSSASTSGAQFALYETSSCLTADAWQMAQVYCADIITDGASANLSSVMFQPNTTYYLMVDAFAGRNCELDLILDILIPDGGDCISVPVELSTFYAKDENCTVSLHWKTETEQNSSHFEVLKSADGLDFERIGSVQAAGNSVESIEYSFVDKTPEVLNYYRLRQVDLDGSEEYSETIIIKPVSCGGDKFDIERVYPNPTSDWLNVDLNLPTATQAKLTISDMSGKVVLQQMYTLSDGAQRVQVPVYDLSKGFYTLIVSTSDGLFATPHRFVVNQHL